MKFSTCRLYNVDPGTHLELLDTKRCIIWGRGRAGPLRTQILY